MGDMCRAELAEVLTHPHRDVLALIRERRLLIDAMQARRREHFAVEPFRERRRLDVARVVRVVLSAGANHGVDDRRVRQRAVGGDAHHDIGVVLASRLHVTAQHVVLRTSCEPCSRLERERSHRVVTPQVSRGHDDSIDKRSP